MKLKTFGILLAAVGIIFINQRVYASKIDALDKALINSSLYSVDLCKLDAMSSDDKELWARKYGLDLRFTRIFNQQGDSASVEFKFWNPGILGTRHVVFEKMPYYSKDGMEIKNYVQQEIKNMPKNQDIHTYIKKINNDLQDKYASIGYNPSIEIEKHIDSKKKAYEKYRLNLTPLYSNPDYDKFSNKYQEYVYIDFN